MSKSDGSQPDKPSESVTCPRDRGGCEWPQCDCGVGRMPDRRQMAQPVAPSAGVASFPEVRLGDMHESNGRVTWIVSLAKTPDAEPWHCHQVYADTIKGRAEYEAAKLRHFLGQGPEPDILAFDVKDATPVSAREAASEWVWWNKGDGIAVGPRDVGAVAIVFTVEEAQAICRAVNRTEDRNA